MIKFSEIKGNISVLIQKDREEITHEINTSFTTLQDKLLTVIENLSTVISNDYIHAQHLETVATEISGTVKEALSSEFVLKDNVTEILKTELTGISVELSTGITEVLSNNFVIKDDLSVVVQEISTQLPDMSHLSNDTETGLVQSITICDNKLSVVKIDELILSGGCAHN